MAEYYIRYNGQQYGPMPKDQLKSYGLNHSSMVWTQGMPNWAAASTVPELREILGNTPPPYNGSAYSGNNAFSNLDSIGYTGASGKSRLVFALFDILIGVFGIQYFYVGKTAAGIICILLSLITFGIWNVVCIIQGILVLMMSQDEFERKYVYGHSTFPLF